MKAPALRRRHFAGFVTLFAVLTLLVACGAQGALPVGQPNGSLKSTATPRHTIGLTQFIGQWHVHGASLTINADGTGVEWWNMGPCFDSFSDPAPPFCAGNEDIMFTANTDGTITGTVTKVWYTQGAGSPAPASYDPGSGGAAVGDAFTLRVVKPQLLLFATWINRPDFNAGGNNYWCNDQYSGPECGA